MEVIKTHYDFTNAALEFAVSNTTPAILYKRDTLTRYVLVVEDTKDMLQRVSEPCILIFLLGIISPCP